MVKRDVPGNTMASVAEYQRQLVRLAEAVLTVDKLLDDLAAEDVWVQALRVLPPPLEGGDWRLILKVRIAEKPYVAFCNGSSFGEVVKAMVNRLQNRTVKWKEDQYA